MIHHKQLSLTRQKAYQKYMRKKLKTDHGLNDRQTYLLVWMLSIVFTMLFTADGSWAGVGGARSRNPVCTCGSLTKVVMPPGIEILG